MYRSSHRRCSVKKKKVFKHFATFTGKHLFWSLFLKTFRDSAKCLRKPFFTELLRWLFLYIGLKWIEPMVLSRGIEREPWHEVDLKKCFSASILNVFVFFCLSNSCNLAAVIFQYCHTCCK